MWDDTFFGTGHNRLRHSTSSQRELDIKTGDLVTFVNKELINILENPFEFQREAINILIYSISN